MRPVLLQLALSDPVREQGHRRTSSARIQRDIIDIASLPWTPRKAGQLRWSRRISVQGRRRPRHLRRQARACAPRSQLLSRQAGRRQDRNAVAGARDIDYILVDNEKEALALRETTSSSSTSRASNVLLRDDKTYPTSSSRVRSTAGLRDAPAAQGRRDLLGPYFPPAWRTAWCISSTGIPGASCKVDLTRYHPKPCLQYHSSPLPWPCVEGLTTDERTPPRCAT